jgi:hypothetical protein
VPGPGLEKKIENGVWLAAVPLPASVADTNVGVEAGALAPALRTLGLLTAAVALEVATRTALRTGAICAAEST